MARFTPTSVTRDPPDPPDHLGSAVLHSLSRVIGARRLWGVLGTLVLGGASLGVLPILLWPRRFARFVSVEQQQYWHLAEWVRLRSSHPDATHLKDAADRIRVRPLLAAASLVCLLTVAALFVMRFRFLPFSMNELIAAAYPYAWSHSFQVPRWIERMWVATNVGLGLAFLLHAAQVKLHTMDVRRFVALFNRVAEHEGVAPVMLPSLAVQLRPLWVLFGLAMALCGGFWALPMMLAGSAQRRYVVYTSRLTRAELAHRVRAMLLNQRPAVSVPLPMNLRRLCTNPRCQSALPADANFCPRCGMRAAGVLDQVA